MPILAGTSVQEWPDEARSLQEILPLTSEGVIVLGTEAAGEFALPLGPWAAAAGETRKRAAQACILANAARQLVMRPPLAGGKQVAYRIVGNIDSVACP